MKIKLRPAYRTLLCFLLLGFAQSLDAAIIVSAQSGPWSSPSTWVGNTVPNLSGFPFDDAIIESGHNVTRSGTLTITNNASLTIRNGGFFNLTGNLTIQNSTSRLNVNTGGELVVAGTLTLNASGQLVDLDNGTISVNDVDLATNGTILGMDQSVFNCTTNIIHGTTLTQVVALNSQIIVGGNWQTSNFSDTRIDITGGSTQIDGALVSNGFSADVVLGGIVTVGGNLTIGDGTPGQNNGITGIVTVLGNATIDQGSNEIFAGAVLDVKGNMAFGVSSSVFGNGVLGWGSTSGPGTITATGGPTDYNLPTEPPCNPYDLGLDACGTFPPKKSVVTDPGDIGNPFELRTIVGNSNDGDTICFDFDFVANPTILLTSGEILIDKSLVIEGPGRDSLQISGTGSSRIFNIPDAVINVEINNLQMDNGNISQDGGGIFCGRIDTFRVYGCGFQSNLATGPSNGGALFIDRFTFAEVDSCVFSGNSADNGGAIAMESDAILHVDRSRFENSLVNGSGGAIDAKTGGKIFVEASSFDNTDAGSGGEGGAIYFEGDSLFVRSTTFVRCDADNGGAIATKGNYLLSLSNTFALNNAVIEGGSVHFEGALFQLANTVTDSCTAPLGVDIYLKSGSGNSFGFNHIDNPSSIGISPIGSDQFGVKAGLDYVTGFGDHGGSAYTLPLLPTGNAVDNGNDFGESYDGRGFPRIAGSQADAGAFELAVSGGAHYYVNDNVMDGSEAWTSAIGNDGTGDGSPSAPYETIAQVFIDHSVGPGDTIFVDVGTAYPQFQTITGGSGASGNPIVIQGAAAFGLCEFVGSSPSTTLTIDNVDFLTIRGMSLHNLGGGQVVTCTSGVEGLRMDSMTIDHDDASGFGGGIIVDGDSSYFDACTFVSSALAIHFQDGVNGPTIYNCQFSFNGSIANNSIQVDNVNGLYVERSSFQNTANGDAGVYFPLLKVGTGHLFSNCLFIDYKTGIDNQSQTHTTGIMHHNSFYTTETCIGDEFGGWDIRNNIFYTTGTNTSNYCCVYDNGLPSLTDNNLFYYPSGARAAWYNGAAYPTLNNYQVGESQDLASFDGDPEYVNPTSGNLQINPTSPANNTADDGTSVSDDFAGNSRPGSGKDVGAYYQPLDPPVAGNIYYVNDAVMDGGEYWCTNPGSVVGDGSTGNPYLTIEDVFLGNVMGPGDTVFVDQGSYDGTQSLTGQSGGAGQPIVIKGTDNYTSYHTANGFGVLRIDAGFYIRIESLDLFANGPFFAIEAENTCLGLEVVDCHIQQFDIGNAGGGIRVDGDGSVITHDSIVTVGTCIEVEDGANNVDITSNYISTNNVQTGADGVVLNSVSDLYMAGNIVNAITGGNVGVSFPPPASGTNVTFVNNYFSNYGVGIESNAPGQTDAIVWHNSFYTTSTCLRDELTNWDIRNNIFYTQSGIPAENCISFNGVPLISENNVFYAPNGASIGFDGSSHSNLSSWNGSTGFDAASSESDPLYDDPANGFLDILSGSPADGAADETVGVTEDIYENPRPGSGTDIGAFSLAPPSGNNIYVNDAVMQGSEVWTSVPGNDGTGDGTVGNPYQTLTYVFDNVSLGPNDTIFVDQGVYNGYHTVIGTGAEGAPIVIQGADSSLVVLTNNINRVIDVLGGSHIHFEDLTIAQTGDFNTVHISGGASDVAIQDCYIQNMGPLETDYAVETSGESLLLNNNRIYSWGHGLLLGDNDHVVIGNEIEIENSLSSGFGIVLSTADSSVIANNFIRDLAGFGSAGVFFVPGVSTQDSIVNNYISGFDWGVNNNAATVDQMLVIHNSIHCNNGIGNSLTNWSIENNIISSPSASPSDFGVVANSVAEYPSIMDNNLYYVPNGAQVAQLDGIDYSALNVLYADLGSFEFYGHQGDPKFVDPANHNLDLNAGSPANGYGYFHPFLGFDIYYNPRSDTADIGAFTIGGNAIPSYTHIDADTLYVGEEDTCALDGFAYVQDPDHDNLVYAHVRITGNYQAPFDTLFAGALYGGITPTWNEGLGRLTLTGSAPLADYEQTLHDLKYFSSAEDPDTNIKTIEYKLFDGVDSSTTYYLYYGIDPEPDVFTLVPDSAWVGDTILAVGNNLDLLSVFIFHEVNNTPFIGFISSDSVLIEVPSGGLMVGTDTTEIPGDFPQFGPLFTVNPDSILLGPVPTSVCYQDSFYVSFDAQGNFGPGNVFTAEVSNVGGIFPGTPIGSIVSNNNGVDSIFVGVGESPGVGYRIRVTASNPSVISADNGSDITVHDSPYALAYDAFFPACLGDSITVSLSTTVSGQTYDLYYEDDGVPDTLFGLTNGAPTFKVPTTLAGKKKVRIVGLMTTDGCLDTTSVYDSTDVWPANIVTISGSTNISCYGLNDGTATGLATGASPSYTWQPTLQNTAMATALSPGLHELHVTDINGCYDSASVFLTEPDTLAFSTGFSQPTCALNDGEITISGLTPLQIYSVTYHDPSPQPQGPLAADGSGDITIGGLGAGSYSNVTIDSGSCSTVDPVFFNLFNPVDPTFSVGVTSDPTSCGGAEGEITVSGLESGAFYTITYNNPGLFNNGLVAANGTGEISLTGLTAASYTNITVDSAGCSDVDAGPYNLIDPPAPVFAITTTDPSCHMGTDGDFVINGLTGVTNYTVSYDNPTTVGPTPRTSDGPGNIPFPSLTAGSITNISVTEDATGCVTVDAGPYVLTDPDDITFSVTTTPISCAGNDGILSINDLTPGASYTIRYNDGAPQSAATGVIGPGGDFDITAILNGTSITNVYVDSSICSSSVTEFGPYDFNRPNNPSFSVVTTDPTTCAGSDGQLNISGLFTGTVYNVTYYNPAKVGPVPLLAGAPGIIDITGLVDGTYTNVVVDSAGGCKDSLAGPFVVNDPTAPIIVTSSSNPTACFANDGVITIAGLNPTTPYDVDFDSAGFPMPTVNTSSDVSGEIDITGLYEGPYMNIRVTTNACVSNTESETLTDPTTPFITTSFTDPTSCFGADGTVTISGLLPTTFYDVDYDSASGPVLTRNLQSTIGGDIILTGLDAVLYDNITVTSFGCVSNPESELLNDPSAPIITVSSVDPSFCGALDGSFTVEGLSPVTLYTLEYDIGVSPQSFSLISNGSGEIDQLSLGASSYSNIRVTINNCTSNFEGVILSDPSPPFMSAIKTADPSCAGNDGIVSITGLLANESYSVWYDSTGGSSFPKGIMSSPTGDLDISGLIAGEIYSNFQAEAYGCTSFDAGAISMNALVLPNFIVAASNGPSCAGGDGDITLSGLQDGFMYDVYMDSNDVQIGPFSVLAAGGGMIVLNGLHAATYDSIMVDSLGCQFYDPSPVVLTDPSGPTFGVSTSDVICYGQFNGLIDITNLSSGQSYNVTYTHSDFGVLGPFPHTADGSGVINTLGSQGAASFTNIIVDSSGCSTTLPGPFLIDQPDSLRFVVDTVPITCSENDGKVEISGLESGQSYTVNYDNGGVSLSTGIVAANGLGVIEISPILNDSIVSNFSIDSAGCTSQIQSVSYQFVAPKAPTFTLNVNPASCTANTGDFWLSGVAPSASYDVIYDDPSPQNVSRTATPAGNINFLNQPDGSIYSNIRIDSAGCESDTAVGVADFTAPVAPVVTASKVDMTCAGDSGKVVLSGLQPSTVYGVTSYLNGSRSGPGPATSNGSGEIEITGLVQGDTVELLKVDSAGCLGSVLPDVFGFVAPAVTIPSGAAMSDPSTCEANDGNITFSGYSSGVMYTVDFDSGGSPMPQRNVLTDGSGNLIITNLYAGPYFNFVIDSGGCSYNHVGFFSLNDPTPPSFTVAVAHPSVLEPDSGKLVLSGLNSSNFYGVTYRDTAGVLQNPGPLLSSGLGEIKIDGLHEGSYSDVSVDSGGCVSTDFGPFLLQNQSGPGGVSNGLELWLKADAGTYEDAGGSDLAEDGDGVLNWADNSSMGNDGIEAGVSIPVLRENTFNHYPVIEFGNGGMGYFDVDLDPINNSDFSIIAVTKRQTGVGQQYILGTQASLPNQGLHFGYRSSSSATLDHFANAIDVVVPSYSDPSGVGLVYGKFDQLLGRSVAEVIGGVLYSNSGSSLTPLTGNNQGNVGRGNGVNGFTGQMAEMIVYSESISPMELGRVKSYLGVKYGLTLPMNYISSNGSVIWDTLTQSGYNIDIAGVGIDSASGLSQDISGSINPSSIVTMLNSADLQDGEYLLWGNNGVTSDSVQTSDIPAGINYRTSRIWRVAETGDVGTVDVKIYIGDLPVKTQNWFDYNLLVSSTPSMAGGTVVSGSSLSNDTVTFSGVDFSDGDYFTLGMRAYAPAGVAENLEIWFSAEGARNGGVAAAQGDPVTHVVDRSAARSSDATDAQNGGNSPLMEFSDSLGMNMQPVLKFSSANEFLDYGSDFVFGDKDGLSIFAVARPKSSSLQQPYIIDFGQTITAGYGMSMSDFLVSGYTSTLANGGNNVVPHGSGTKTKLQRLGVDFSGMQVLAVNSDTLTASPSIPISHLDTATINESATKAFDAGPVTIGSTSPILGGQDSDFEGELAEVLVFNDKLDALKVAQIETYLALKYGVSLTQDYYSSSGAVVYNTTTTHSGYANDIISLCVDDISTLNKYAGITADNDAPLFIHSPSNLSSGEYLVMGSNGISKDSIQSNDVPVGYSHRLQRSWRVNETGDVGSIVMMLRGLVNGFMPQSAGDYGIVIGSSPTLNVGSVTSAVGIQGDTVVFAGIDLNDNDYFSIVFNLSGPIANYDTVIVPQDTSIVAVAVTSNDTDADNNIDTSSVSLLSSAIYGTAILGSGDTIWYMPAVDFCGVDSVQYEVCDSTALCDSAWVHFDVQSNGIPVSVSIAGPTTICLGDRADFTISDSTSGGASPNFDWYVNSVQVGISVDSHSTTGLLNGDTVMAIMTSSSSCAVPSMDTAMSIVTVNPIEVPSVSIDGDSVLCDGLVANLHVDDSTGGGSNPSFQWFWNSIAVGSDSDLYSTGGGLVDGDTISVVMTANGLCANPASDTAFVTLEVIPRVIPSVVTTGDSAICAGTLANISVSDSTNGGADPGFQWHINGVPVGADTNGYSSSTLADGDTVMVVMIASSEVCPLPTTDTAFVTMEVTPLVAPSVAIDGDSMICAGTTANFNVSDSTGGGPNPVFTWYVNGLLQLADTSYQSSALTDGDTIMVIMTPNTTCPDPATDTTFITMDVTPTTVPVVTIEGDSTICAGATANFSVTDSTGGGSNPSYQWMVNGLNVGTDLDLYSTSSLVDGDTVMIVMTPNTTCPDPATDTAIITMDVSPTDFVNLSIDGDSAICDGEVANFEVTDSTGSGLNPAFQWLVNGLFVGPDTNGFSSVSLNDGDTVMVIVVPNSHCPSPVVDTAYVTMDVTPTETPVVAIDGDSVICSGELAQFSVVDSSGGGNNPSFNWFINGTLQIGDTVTASPSLLDGDTVMVVMASSSLCPTASTDSAFVTVDVSPVLVPSVSFYADSVICDGASAQFGVTDSTNGGVNPSFTWLVNGISIGTDTVFVQPSLSDGDTVSVVMQSSEACANPQFDTAFVTIDANPLLTASVGMSADSIICAGETANFQVTDSTNGGLNPTFVWFINGVFQTGDTTFSSNALSDGDTIMLRMVSSEACVIQAVDEVEITMDVSPELTPNVAIDGDSIICDGETAVFNIVDSTNGGTDPAFTWYINGLMQVGDTSYQSNFLSDGDTISAVMVSNVLCANPAQDSTAITVQVNPNVVPFVAIDGPDSLSGIVPASYQIIDSTNGGSNPGFSWFVNGISVSGDTNAIDAGPVGPGDSIVVLMQSIELCAFPVNTSDTIVIVSIAVNAPVLQEDTLEINEDAGLQMVSITGLTTDLDGDQLIDTFDIVTLANHADTLYRMDGDLMYKSDSNFFGADSVQLSVCDAQGLCDTAWVYFDIASVVDRPIAGIDSAVAVQGCSTTILDLVANDIGQAGSLFDPLESIDPSSLQVLDPLDGVDVSLNGVSLEVDYEVVPLFAGTDSINYVVCNVGAVCDTGLVVIEVGAGVGPTTERDTASYFIGSGQTVVVDVLSNDGSNADSSSLMVLSSVISEGMVEAVGGKLEISGYTDVGNDGSFDFVIYQVCDFDSCACSSDTLIIMLDQPGLVEAIFQVSPTQVCLGDTVFIDDASNITDSASTKVQWSFGGGSSSADTTTSGDKFIVFDQAGTFDISLSLNDTSALLTDDTTLFAAVTVSPKPESSSVINGGTDVCEGQGPVSYWVDSVGGYTWAVSSGSVIFGQGTDSILVDTLNGDFEIQVYETSAMGCLGDTLSLTVGVDTIPSNGFVNGITSSCVNTTGVEFAPAGMPNATAYEWLMTGGSMVSGINDSVLVVDIATSDVSIKLVASNYCGAADTIYHDLVAAGNFAAGLLPDTNAISVCGGSTINIMSQGSFGTYQWYQDGVEIVGADSASYETGDQGSYHAIISDGVCSGSTDTLFVEVKANNDFTLEDELSCDTELTKSVDGLVAGTSYRWFEIQSPNDTLSTTNSLFLDGSVQSGNYVLQAVHPVSACSKTDTAILSVQPEFETEALITESDHSTQIFIDVFQNGQKVENDTIFVIDVESHKTNEKAQVIEQLGTTILHYVPNSDFSGKDTIVYTVRNACADSSGVKRDTVFLTVTPVFVDDQITGVDGEIVTISLDEITGNDLGSIDKSSFEFLDTLTVLGFSIPSFSSDSASLILDLRDSIVIDSVILTDGNIEDSVRYRLCDANDSCEILFLKIQYTNYLEKQLSFVEEAERAVVIDVYNAVSPNGDGLNDRFAIYVFDAETEELLNPQPEVRVVIFGRDGRQVYFQDNYQVGYYDWDGTFNGEVLPDGNYFYVVEVQVKGQRTATKEQGVVYLKREK